MLDNSALSIKNTNNPILIIHQSSVLFVENFGTMITDIFSSPDTKIPTSESTSNILSPNPIQSISLVQSLTMRFLPRAKHKSTRQLCSSKFEAKHTCSITYSSSVSIPCENPSEIMLYLAKVVFYLPPQVLFQVHSLQQQQIYLFPRISPLSVTPPQTRQMKNNWQPTYAISYIWFSGKLSQISRRQISFLRICKILLSLVIH